jgi:hypothetical protein
VSELERRVGPVLLTWSPEERLARLSFVEPGVGGRTEAEVLAQQLEEWTDGGPFGVLVDCSDIVDADAGWRSVFGQWFRDRRERGRIAWFNANPRVRLLVLMFRKGTGVHGRAFATEAEARAWLEDEQRAS